MRNNILIFKILLSLAGIIVLLHFLFHPVRIWGWKTSVFYLDERYTFGAYYTMGVYFLTSFMAFLAVLCAKIKREKLVLSALSFFFLILSMDEYFEVHEHMREVVQTGLAPESFMGKLTALSWVFPFFVGIALVFALISYYMWTEKNKRIKNLLTIGMILYILVLVLELTGGSFYGDYSYVWFVGFEEGFEMISAAVFLYAMMEKYSLVSKP